MPEPELHALLLRQFNALDLPYMVTGGVAAIIYSEPRLTNDVDIVAAILPQDAERVASMFPPPAYYAPPAEVIREEASRDAHGHFVVGVYGVMSRVARGRSREMGIRVALGAQAGELRWLVVQRGLALTLIGIAIGVAGALVATQSLRTLLYRVEPADPATFVVVSVLLAAAAVVACWVPAARASRSDPVAALRME